MSGYRTGFFFWESVVIVSGYRTGFFFWESVVIVSGYRTVFFLGERSYSVWLQNGFFTTKDEINVPIALSTFRDNYGFFSSGRA